MSAGWRHVALLLVTWFVFGALSTAQAQELIGTYVVNYRTSAAGCPGDPNPFHCISGSPHHVDAPPGRYRAVVTDRAGNGGNAVIWSGDEASGTSYGNLFDIGYSVDFDHRAGQITLFAYDWFVGDNDPSQTTTIVLYRLDGSACPIPDLRPLSDEAQPFEQGSPQDSLIPTNVDPYLDLAIRNLERLFPTIVRVSGYRPPDVQAHFLDIRETDKALRNLTEPEHVQACRDLQRDVLAEIGRHGLRRIADSQDLAVNTESAHTFLPARAVDLGVGNLGNAVWRALSRPDIKLHRPCPRDPAFHVSLRHVDCHGRIVATAHSPVALLVTDPLGRRVGFDIVIGQMVNEIGESASYNGIASEPQVVEIDGALPGPYLVAGTGVSTGPYTLALTRLTDDGDAIEEARQTGTAEPGSQHSLVRELPRTVPVQIVRERSRGFSPRPFQTIDVAVMSSPEFDAPREVRPRTLSLELFGNDSAPLHCGWKDVDNDDLGDLVCTFRMHGPARDETNFEALLSGRTRAGRLFEGSDIVDVPNLPDRDGRRHGVWRWWRLPRR